MKKKFFVILMLLALVATMMPLSAFAAEKQNSKKEVITPIGDTGLYLVGDRKAKQSTSWDKPDGDYYIYTDYEPYYVNVDTDNWELRGTSNYNVWFTPNKPDQKIVLGDVEVPVFAVENNYSTNIKVKNGAKAIFTELFDIKGNVTLSGQGYIEAQGMNYWEGSYITIDGPTFYSHNEVGDCHAICADKGINIKSGKVIAIDTFDRWFGSALFTLGDISISDEAEVFASSENFALISFAKFNFDKEKCYGNTKSLQYESKDDVISSVAESKTTFDFESFSVLTVKHQGKEKFAKTVYHPGTKIHQVQFFNNNTLYKNQYVEDGKCVTEPKQPTKKGFKFNGWFINPAAAGSGFDFKTPIKEDTKLYADWIKKTDPKPNPDPNPPIDPAKHSPNDGGINTGDNSLVIIFAGLGIVTIAAAMVAGRRIRNKNK